MKPYFLALFILIAALLPARAIECDLDVLLPQIVAHENYAGHVMLDADHARRSLTILSDGPDPSDVREGLLVLLKNGPVLLMLWRLDGSCGYAMVAEPEQLLRAIKGTGA